MMTDAEVAELFATDPTGWQRLVMGGPQALSSWRLQRERELAQLADDRPHPQSHAGRYENPFNDSFMTRALRLW